MLSDLRFALRQLRKSPGFTFVAVLTLALGIGANTAIFSIVEGTLLRPLPFPHAERLVRLYEAESESGVRGNTVSLSEQTLRQWREFGGEIFEGIAAATETNVVVGSTNRELARNIVATRISANFFSVLGLPPARGRDFTAEEDRAGGPAVVIVSDDFWRNHLGSRADVLGSTVTLDGVVHTVVGLMPKSFRHPYRADLWVPLALPTASPGAGLNHYLYTPARLRPGMTLAQAEEAVRRMCAAINQANPSPTNAHGVYMPRLRDSFVQDLRPKILLIVAAALCALLIAAANFAGLLLSRVIEREGEFALRAALGASRKRLVRQQLTQALLLAVLGTLLGLALASWATPALFALSPEGSDITGSAMREFDDAARLDWPVFGFASCVMMLVGAGFGLLPAMRAARTNLRGAMNTSSRGTTLDRGTRGLLGSLVVTELAVAATLLMARFTTTQYFRKLLNEPWGFATAHRTIFNTMISDRLFADATLKRSAVEQTLTALRALPGVKSATVTSPAPMNAPRNLMSFNAEGVPAPEPSGSYLSYARVAVPGYFRTMEESLLSGREFLETDATDTPLVCLVTEALAKRFWPAQNPIGKRIKSGRLDGPRPWLTIVGVVADMKAVADPRDGEVIGMIARPLAQVLPVGAAQIDEVTYVVERETGPLPEAAIRNLLARVDPRLAAYEMSSLDRTAAESRALERFIFVLVSSFSVLGVVLAAVGLYGLLALQVARRQREFGIRSALGATAKQIIKLIAREGATLLSLGFAAGALATWGMVRVVRSQWGELPAPSFIAWICAAIVLGLAVMIACWLPARRAARVDPVVALRVE